MILCGNYAFYHTALGNVKHCRQCLLYFTSTDNWALNKTIGTGYSGFVGPKKAFSVRFFYDSSTDKAKRRKNRENISAQRVGCTENGSVTTRSLELFAFLFNARKSLDY